jgi:hypothetical protein
MAIACHIVLLLAIVAQAHSEQFGAREDTNIGLGDAPALSHTVANDSAKHLSARFATLKKRLAVRVSRWVTPANTSRLHPFSLPFYLGCNTSLARVRPDGSAKAACKSLGLERTGTRADSGQPIVKLRGAKKVVDWTNKKRAAVCMVGQMRSFPVAFANWKNEGLFPLMETANTELDLYVITEDSVSFELSASILDSLPLAERVVVSKASFKFRPNEDWAWRDSPDANAPKLHGHSQSFLEFNEAHFPHGEHDDESEKRDSYFMQLWQMRKCKDLILANEQKHGFEYKRLARMRTDVLFRASPFILEDRKSFYQKLCFADRDLGKCAAAIASIQSQQLHACQSSIVAGESQNHTYWMLEPENDRAIIGSRGTVLASFAGLDWLADEQNRNFTGSWNPQKFILAPLVWKSARPRHCDYRTPILRMGQIVNRHGSRPRAVPGDDGAAVEPLYGLDVYDGSAVGVSDAQIEEMCMPGTHLPDSVRHLAIRVKTALPIMERVARCMEIGVCPVVAIRGSPHRRGCNIAYGEEHVKLKADADTVLNSAKLADFGGFTRSKEQKP